MNCQKSYIGLSILILDQVILVYARTFEYTGVPILVKMGTFTTSPYYKVKHWNRKINANLNTLPRKSVMTY